MAESGGRQTTSLVTGANTGIGRATAHELARRGHRVILACRSAESTRPVIDAITADTGNAALEHLPLDLADLESVRCAAATLVERGEPIHVLVANAGVAAQRGVTSQGFELAFGVNHLGCRTRQATRRAMSIRRIPTDGAMASSATIPDEAWDAAATAHARLKGLLETKPRAKARYDALLAKIIS